MNMIKIIPSQLITIKSDEKKIRKNQPDYKLGGGKSSTVISILEHINVFETQSNPPQTWRRFQATLFLYIQVFLLAFSTN